MDYKSLFNESFGDIEAELEEPALEEWRSRLSHPLMLTSSAQTAAKGPTEVRTAERWTIF